ncbi:mutator family transposase [Hydromonas duriensis]|uniref:Mutator family transposase n=2 Tax=Hydromonas duriensis TaxID=1527608 RepID=A0A4R6Y6Y7_9BURK|nr:mutator family transposase [Hydromonas duriensis]
MKQHLNAERYEHSDERTGVRNGNRIRKIHTRVGTLKLQVPQTRDGSFCTDIFKRYQRNEQALVLAMMEMYVQGVSTRKVSAITEELCGTSFSKSLVSSLCVNLDARVKAFTNRRLDGEYPVLMVDAMYIKARRHDDRVVSRAALIMSAVRSDGYREIVGLEIDNGKNMSILQRFNAIVALIRLHFRQ